MFAELVRKTYTVVQKILVTVFLFVVYIVMFGLTVVFLLIFNRAVLFPGIRKKKTFWEKAEDYDADIDTGMRQS